MDIMFSFSLYFLSFLPLWISIIFIDVKSIIEKNSCLWTEYISIICVIVFILVSIGVVFGQFSDMRQGSKEVFVLIEAKEAKTVTSEYLLSYILPLFAFDFAKWDEVVLFLIFFLTFAFLCIKHNYFSVNLLLELANYRFYECIIENEDKVKISQMIISKECLSVCVGQEVGLKSINNDYRLEID